MTPEVFFLLRERIQRGGSLRRKELSAGIPDRGWQERCKLLNSFRFALLTCSSKLCARDTRGEERGTTKSHFSFL